MAMDFNEMKEVGLVYKRQESDIIVAKGRVDVYSFGNWKSILNANEHNVFESIRIIGAPLLPQYPAGKYYLDFGNPYYKIGLEVDSITFHDREKDIKRDMDLKELGWKIFHLTSRESFRFTGSKHIYNEDSEDDSDYLKFLEMTIEGLLICIRHTHLDGYTIRDGFEEKAREISNNHLFI
jgi:hypothetical protein